MLTVVTELIDNINSVILTDGQCADNINTNVQRMGSLRLRRRVQVVVPQDNFTCNGRLTRIMASMLQEPERNDSFLFQVWRPSFLGSTLYNRVGQIALRESDVTEFIVNITTNTVNITTNTSYYLVNMSLTGGERIEFQSGDVMGYYHPLSPRYRVYNDPEANNYVTYGLDNDTGPTETFNISDSSVSQHNNRQPLFAVNFGE